MRARVEIGAVYPHTELPPDGGAIRAYFQAIESLGYSYLTVYDHVVGADPSAHPGWEPRGPGQPFYTHLVPFSEPLVLLSYAAATTTRLGLATSVLVLGQRQTALVAKQAADLDQLSGGRLRLGVGTGWNDLEYQAMGWDFDSRGPRTDEQIALLRRLWTEETVTYHGTWHELDAVGLRPLPIQRPIPVWIGGESAPAFRRAARLGDGCCFNVGPVEGEARMQMLRRYLADEDRTFEGFGVETIVRGAPDLDGIPPTIEAWTGLGATHLAVDLMYAGLNGVDNQIKALTDVAAALRLP